MMVWWHVPATLVAMQENVYCKNPSSTVDGFVSSLCVCFDVCTFFHSMFICAVAQTVNTDLMSYFFKGFVELVILMFASLETVLDITLSFLL